MNSLPITLGGTTAPWVSQGLTSFEAFLSEAGLTDLQVAWATLPSGPFGESLQKSLLRLCETAADGGDSAKLQTVEIRSDQGSFCCVLAEALLYLNVGSEAALKALEQALGRSPHILVIDARTLVDGNAWLEDGYRLLSAIRGARGRIVLLTEATAPPSAFTFDMTSLGPFMRLDWADSMKASWWEAYLHHRVHWESQGRCNVLHKWCEPLASVRAVPFGADDVLERHLGKIAEELATKQGAPFHRTLQEFRESPSHQAFQDLLQELELVDLVDVDSLTNSPLPPPWLGRYLLQRANPPEAIRIRLLEHITPIALREQLFRCCLDAERQARRAHCNSKPGEEGAARDLEVARSSHRRYCPNVPEFAPRCIEEVSGLGDARRSGGIAPKHMEVVQRVGSVRNHVAHGGYISWGCLKEMMDLATALRVAS